MYKDKELKDILTDWEIILKRWKTKWFESLFFLFLRVHLMISGMSEEVGSETRWKKFFFFFFYMREGKTRSE